MKTLIIIAIVILILLLTFGIRLVKLIYFLAPRCDKCGSHKYYELGNNIHQQDIFKCKKCNNIYLY